MYSLNMSHIILHYVGNTILVHVHSRTYNLRCPKSQFGLTDACHIITTQFVATGASAVVRSFGIVATVTTATIIAGTFIDICINQNELSYRVTFGRGEGGGARLVSQHTLGFSIFIIPLKPLPLIPLPTHAPLDITFSFNCKHSEHDQNSPQC